MEVAFIDLLNSYWRDYRGSGRTEDRLLLSGWLESFLAQWDLGDPGPITPDELARLQELREWLRHLTENLVQQQLPSPEEITRLNDYMKLAPSYPQLIVNEGYHLELKPVQASWNWVLSQIAASFADLLVQHEPSRLKICENSDCRWVFYDATRSHTQRWCADECANLIKVRRFRAKHA